MSPKSAVAPPRLLVSAAHKSSGKTTIAIGLCAALRARGHAVQPFKKGPDYIDPLWLSAACARPCRNLDPWLSDDAELAGALVRHAAGADIAIVEGNKGLYDGLALDGSNSNAALAKALSLPVVLVIDARGMTRGIAPLIGNVLFNLLWPARGRARIEARIESTLAEAQSGCVELRSLGHPFRGRSTEIESVCIYLPRERFTRVNAKLDARNNSILTGNFADLLTDFIERTAERLRVLTAEDLPRVVQATSDLIVAGLTAGTKSELAPSQLSSLALMERARRYIQTNLNIIDLTPDGICRDLGVSRTRLYQLFEASGGVVAYVQKRRLIASHQALGDPADARRIAEIAESCGFSSAASFTRAFTREFGYSPREARSALAEDRLSDV
jgi:AraC-like DNA-binding protein